MITAGKSIRVHSTVKSRILRTFEVYHRPEHLTLDPLIAVRSLHGRENREIGGFIAAVLSYGRVETIIRNIETVFTIMKRRPSAFTYGTDLEVKRRALHGFRHRFNDGDDLALLLQSIASLTARERSMEPLLRKMLDNSENGMRGALSSFSAAVRSRARELQPAMNDSFAFLVPSPATGSACKRLAMFLRWMVRPDDGIDLGVWRSLPTAALVMPVDTHIARIARREGMTTRKAADWRMAEEITAWLRRIDPLDPVRFDFSLCRLGMTAARKEAA